MTAIPKFAVLIPARLASVRLPRKLLLRVQGKSVLQWTWEAAATSGAAFVAIVTGDAEIAEEGHRFGATVITSLREHDSGTSRIAAAVSCVPRGVNVIINVQGDEPCLPSFWPMRIAQRMVADRVPLIDICTLVCKLPDRSRDDAAVVKVAVGCFGKAHWFSRSPMAGAMQHMGVYGFHRHQLTSLPPRTLLSAAENLEQLSWIENGYSIGTLEADAPTIAIDTAQGFADFKRWASATPKTIGTGRCQLPLPGPPVATESKRLPPAPN